MKTVTFKPREKRPYKWNSDKTIDFYIDGKKAGWFWGISINDALKEIKKSLGVKRVRSEVVYE